MAEGVAAGVAGVTPFPLAACWPLAAGRCMASPLLDGGVNSLVAPGNDSEPGAVKALACAALDGCVWIPSMMGVITIRHAKRLAIKVLSRSTHDVSTGPTPRIY